MENKIINSEEIWKTISEYPNYQVSNLGRIKSVFKNKKERILKCPNGYANLYHQGESRSLSPSRLMYSVFNNIPLSSLDDVFVSGKTMDTLQLLTIEGILKRVRGKKANRTAIEVERMQMETYNDVRAVIHAWKSGDASELYARVESHKDDTIAYLQRGFNVSRSDAEEYWSEASATLYSRVLNKECSISSFAPWLRITARNMVFAVRKERRRVREFDDRRCYELY